jgi:ABC-type transporter Mla MlaB component
MLRISELPSEGSARLLKLEGKLLGPWIDELNLAINRSSTSLDRVRLDLSSLAFVDAAGARALADWIRRGTTVVACSGYVAALLHLERP